MPKQLSTAVRWGVWEGGGGWNGGDSTHTDIGFIRRACGSQDTEIHSYGTVNSQRAWVCVLWRALKPVSKTFPRGRQHATWISIITNSTANMWEHQLVQGIQ